MSDARLSPTTKALLAAAKKDAPSSAARARMWTNAFGATAATGTTAAVTKAGSASAAKMLALGTLLGGAITVGLAAILLRVAPAPAPEPLKARATIALTPDVNVHVPVNVIPARDPDPTPAPPAPPTPSVAAIAPIATVVPIDPLAREASLVAEARGALARGDARSALRAIRAARSLPSHQLDPEELAVEAQALRALGSSDDARAVDTTLRSKYPDSALAR